ncbi:hypothetical protein FJT64_009487 [Amphibalanus amphitrite]|uniref:Uncharacterized protein n=1 Tax=Amphibalanus amphitrite TaxID=1232801 RepID=A0A6A4VDH7_AMPAM|nr:hypothetical protein FJT64_009487 [Amphibalanus amphitrite]
MLCAIRVPGNNLQTNETLKPANFESLENHEVKAALEKVNQEEEELNNVFRKYRLAFWTSTIQEHANEVDVCVGEVFEEMPNSYASCKGVLEHIRAQAKVGKDRQWLSVGCDGQPFDICRKLIDRSVACDTCGEETDADAMEQHHSERHPGATMQFHKLYDWLLLRPGPGHVEMNSCKVIFRLIWVPILQTVSKLLGFVSDAAQLFIKNCGQPTIEQWQQAARCGDRLEDVKASVLARCGVGDPSYSEYAISLHDSVDKVRTELRQRGYLLQPRQSVEYLQSLTGV